MKTFKLFLIALIATTIGLVSCKKDEESIEQVNSETNGKVLVVNFGSYSQGNGEISIYDEKNNTIVNNAYNKINGVKYNSCIQSMAIHNGMAYLMANNGDKIDILDAKTLKVAAAPISDITKPRYFAAEGNVGYISCWGPVTDWSNVSESYIAEVDLITNTITKTIPVPNGPEGLVIANGKLYAALAFARKIAVIDIKTSAVSYINTKAVPQQLVVDNNNNVWASVVSTYSNPSGADSVGLAIINTQNNSVTGYVNFPSISSEGQIVMNSDKSSIYLMGKDAWPGTQSSVYKVDVLHKTIESTPLIKGENFNGIGYNKQSNRIYVFISASNDVNGSLEVYKTDGTLVNHVETSISPVHMLLY